MRFLRTALPALFVLATCAPARGDWTDLHGTQSPDGRVDSGTRWQKAPMPGPPFRLRWSYVNWLGAGSGPTPGPAQVLAWQSPAVAYGNVYVGEYDGRIVAWELATGKPLPGFWQKTGPAQGGSSAMESSPAVANGLVYVGGNDGALYAYNAFSGDPAPGFPRPIATFISASPVVKDGRVFLGTWPVSYGPQRLSPMVAIDAGSGAFLWSYTTDGSALRGAASVSGNTVYFVSGGGLLRAVDAATGQSVWSGAVNVGGYARMGPAVADGWVWTGNDFGVVRCFNGATGAPREGFPVFMRPWGEVESEFALGDGLLFAPSWDFGMWCWNASTGVRPFGSPFWSPMPNHSPPAYCNGFLYYGNDDNVLRAVNTTTKKLEWSYTIPRHLPQYGPGGLKGFNQSGVAVSDGTLVALSEEGNGIYVFEPVPADPTPMPTRVIVHASDNLIVAGRDLVRFHWDLPAAFHVRLAAYNLAGERVRTLFEGDCPGETCVGVWDGRGDKGRTIASGVYVVALSVRGRGVYRVRVVVMNQLE